MIGWLILADEIAFWVLLASGLAARYLLHRRRLSNVLFVCIPLLEVVLLVATAIDLQRGATPRWTHGLAAVYIGWSIAFGPCTIRWADERFAHRYANGPPPHRAPKGPSWERARHEWRSWSRMLLAAMLSCVLLLLAIWYVGDADRSAELWGWMLRMGLLTGVWLIGWPVVETARAVLASSSARTESNE